MRSIPSCGTPSGCRQMAFLFMSITGKLRNISTAFDWPAWKITSQSKCSP
jgi:hypothetical protein